MSELPKPLHSAAAAQLVIVRPMRLLIELAVIVLAAVSLCAADDRNPVPFQNLAASRSGAPPLPRRHPKMSMESAISRSERFLREHGKDPSRYQVESADYGSYSDKPEEDCWSIVWLAKDSATAKPARLRVFVFDETHVFFGGWA